MYKEIKKLCLVILKLKKRKFRCSKTRILLENVDLDKILISNKVSFVEKKLNTLLATKMIMKLTNDI